jgi:hypothetical protein
MTDYYTNVYLVLQGYTKAMIPPNMAETKTLVGMPDKPGVVVGTAPIMDPNLFETAPFSPDDAPVAGALPGDVISEAAPYFPGTDADVPADATGGPKGTPIKTTPAGTTPTPGTAPAPMSAPKKSTGKPGSW